VEIFASKAEKEVERFLKVFLPGTPFEGKAKAIGGYVRDEYLSLIKNDPSIEAKDLDIVVDMKDGSEKLTKFIHEKLKGDSVSTPRQMGENYPIWQITFKDNIIYDGKTYETKGAVIEFADTMKESYPDPESRQRKTEPGTLKEDIERRDFTTNMLLKDLTTGEIEDLTGTSKADIAKGVLKGHPEVSLDKMFNNDPLRMLRLIRFQAKYGWKIPLSVMKAVKRNAKRIEIISSERIRGELEKIAEYGKLRSAIKIMSMTGLLKHVLPEVEELKGVQQNPEHHAEGDVYKHTLNVLKEAPPGVENQLAALLHDVGKSKTTEIIQDKIRSLGHEDVGAEIAEAIMKRLTFDNETTQKVKKMVRNHMRPHFLGEKAGVKALRKFIRDVGDEMVDSILNLARADELGSLPSTDAIPDLKKRIEEVKQKAEIKKEPILDGKEIMKLLNLQTGPEIGKVKEFLKDLEDQYVEDGKTLTKNKAQEEVLKEFKKSASFSRQDMALRIAQRVVDSADKKTADFPNHPDDIVVSKKEHTLGGPEITELDVFSYYTDGVVTEILKELKGRNLFIGVKAKGSAGPRGKPVFIRHPYDKKSDYIRINNEKDFNVYHSGRTIEYHVTMPASCPYYVVDFDAVEDWPTTKKITAECSATLEKLPEVKKVEIRFTGKRGFHILGWLKEPMPIDTARERLKEHLKEAFGDREDLVLGESPSGKKGALGVSPMKLNGGQVVLWSMRVTGLCCVEVPQAKLAGFKKEDARPEVVYKKLTGKTLVPARKKESAQRVINAFLDKTAGYDRDKIKPGYKGKFVIHDHSAEKAGRHFDLRLEFPVTSLKKALGTYEGKRLPGREEPEGPYTDGPGTVYRSFAVRKHQLPTADTKLFIVETEDHPIAYGFFSGKITEGYGKGDVDIFDKGTYEIVDVEGDKKYTLDFKGKKLNGLFALIRYQNGYLWVKTKDQIK
jgi:poly(A) polymerase